MPEIMWIGLLKFLDPDMWGVSSPPCPMGKSPIRTSPGIFFLKFFRMLFILFLPSFVEKFCSKMHSWTFLHRDPTPGAGWTPPDVPLCLEIFQNSIYTISNKFCKKNFALWCIPGLALVGVLPLGQGGRPPRCPGGLENSPNHYLYHYQQVL